MDLLLLYWFLGAFEGKGKFRILHLSVQCVWGCLFTILGFLHRVEGVSVSNIHIRAEFSVVYSFLFVTISAKQSETTALIKAAKFAEYGDL